MRLSIAIADSNALLSAFVVYRGFANSIPRAAELGFEGVELALKRADEIDASDLKRILANNNIEVSCISTGQLYADGGLMLTHESVSQREQAIRIFKELIDLGAEFGQMVNIGRVRGMIGNRNKAEVENMFIEVSRGLCDYAFQKNVSIVLEPINRYETDFVNNINEGSRLLNKINRPNIGLLPDLFHMNIEERNIIESISENIEHIKYIHLADSNRLAPGYGHINFESVFRQLQLSNYNGWICAEILPTPAPDIAARQAANFLLPMIEDYNREQTRKKEMITNLL
jgi:5-keto-L-gluconate epimerase